LSEENEPVGEASSDLQFFDIGEALEEHSRKPGRVDMATSDKCYVALFHHTRRGGGEPHTHSHPDSDQILFIVKGELTAHGLDDHYPLKAMQGSLIPAGVNYGFTNETNDDVTFLSMRTESSGGRRVAYVPSEPSDAQFKIPAAALDAEGLGKHLYVYGLDRKTIGVSPLLLDEWNRVAILRMNCDFDRSAEYVLANLPDRFSRWYQIDDLMEGDYRVIAEPSGTKVKIDLTPAIARRAAYAKR
jgi:mannose-6-phosphate isomerase-like protein (cupin superfamily)